jgi:predicted  nucleic acid-binding Zn-ribbon protein
MMVTNDIAQDIERLIQLQQVYKEVFQLEKIKRELPLNPEQVKEGLADLEDEVQGIAQELDTVESEMKRNNVDIDTLKDRIAKIREQQKIVQSPKEFAYLDTQEKLLKDEIVELEKENKERGKEITELQTKLDEKKKTLNLKLKKRTAQLKPLEFKQKKLRVFLKKSKF